MRRIVRIVLGLLAFGVADAVAPVATPVSATETYLGSGPARVATSAIRAAWHDDGR